MFSGRAAAGFLLMLVGFYVPATASILTIALTDGDASGISGGRFGALSAGALNEAGQVVFSAHLQQGVGGVDLNNDTGIWVFDGSNTILLARNGSGNVPDLVGASFQTFHDVVIDDEGDVVLRAALHTELGGVTNNSKQGFWKYSSGVGVEIARTGSGNVAGVPNASFSSLPFTIAMSRTGQLVYHGFMKIDPEVVTSEDDRGVWSHSDEGSTLVARELVTPPPGNFLVGFHSFGDPQVNDNQEMVFFATVKEGGGVGPLDNSGIWKFSPSGDELLVRTGTENAPGAGSTSFSSLGVPTINLPGQMAFQSGLTHTETVDVANDSGVWLYTGTTGTLLARTGVGGVPELPGAEFAELSTPLLSDSGLALLKAQLVTGPGGVAADDDLGLWAFDGVQSSLVARSGSGGVPRIAAASFSDFDTVTVNSQGLVAVKASLQIGGNVTESNDEGLWLLNPSGCGILVAREGDQLAGHTIAELNFLGDSGSNDGRRSGLNDQGQLVFQANFALGGSGLFLFSPYTADFDLDGDVDSDDLTDPTRGWKARYGAELDGADFLVWQRQFGCGVEATSSSTRVVPEPVAELLLCIGVVVVFQNRNRVRQHWL